MTYVKALTQTGITICATIHSPTAYTFSLFDRLLLLLRGRVVYFGPNGSAAVDFFQKRFPELEGVPDGGNPAEWIVDVTTKADRNDQVDKFVDAYASADLATENVTMVDALGSKHATILDADTQKALEVKRATTTPSWWAYWVLFRYRTLRDWRDPAYLMPRLADKVIFCFIIFTMYEGGL